MSLIAWYPLNGDTKDYSGNQNDLIYYNNNGLIVNNNTGKIGKCQERTALNVSADYLASTNNISVNNT